MKRVLFVSNGHGEDAIALRIARETAGIARERDLDVRLERFSLVGTGAAANDVPLAGPHAVMPSGGLVAMGNAGAILRDLRSGFAGLFARQIAYLRSRARDLDLIVAVGDVYALAIVLLARRPAIFVGTAKSVRVAPYGPFERTVLRRARAVFVRDVPTADVLQAQDVAAQAPGNVIVDLACDGARDEIGTSAGLSIGLLPGSRAQAYGDAVRLAAVYRALAQREPGLRALLSIAPALDPATVARLLAEDGWAVVGDIPARTFTALRGDARIAAWGGSLGGLLRACTIVAGQAGTANEMAAAAGLPVVALELRKGRREDWYRMRQRKLLGDALAIVPADPQRAAGALAEILHDGARLRAMRAAGPLHMGPPGGARAIGNAIADALQNP